MVKKGKNGNGESHVPNIIASGTDLVGDIKSDGDFRIEGSVKGKIIAKGRIVVGESGKVEGEISCNDADIRGKIVGKVEVANLTSLKESANFTGDITTKRISIEPGAVFSGNCTMLTDNIVKNK